MTHPLILVTGATGTIGSEVVKQLVEAGQKVRVLVRDPAKALKFGTGVEVVKGDLAKPETLIAAFAGVDKAFISTYGIDLPIQEANAFDAAKKAGVKHLVKISARHLDADFVAGTDLGRFHNESESRLRALGIPWTVLRPGMLASNFLLWLVREQGAVFLPVGDGGDTPTDPRDVAAVAVKVLTTPGHKGMVYELTGPEFLSFAEMVQRMGTIIGKPLKLVDIPEAVAREGLLAAGVPSTQADGILRYFTDGVQNRAKLP